MVHLCLHFLINSCKLVLCIVLGCIPLRGNWESTRNQLLTNVFQRCIAERYIMHECVTYINMYLNDGYVFKDGVTEVQRNWNLSVVSQVVKPSRVIKYKRLPDDELRLAHWTVLENCEETKPYAQHHCARFYSSYPNATHAHCVHSFILAFRNKMKESHDKPELQILSFEVQSTNIYQQCIVNGVNFVCISRDINLTTQNSGVMVKNDDDLTCYTVIKLIKTEVSHELFNGPETIIIV